MWFKLRMALVYVQYSIWQKCFCLLQNFLKVFLYSRITCTVCQAALLRRCEQWTPPISESAELTPWYLYNNHYSEPPDLPPSCDEQPKTNNRRRTTEDEQPKTNNRRRTTEDEQPKTNNRRRTTEDEQPKTNNQRRTTEDEQPKTNNQRRTTKDEQPKTNNQRRTTEDEQPKTNNRRLPFCINIYRLIPMVG